MKKLLWVLLVLPLFVPAAQAAQGPRTLVTTPTPILGFAQDGSRIAWYERGSKRVRRGVRIRPLGRGRTVVIRSFGVNSRPVDLALAGTRALWVLRDSGNFQYAYLKTGSMREPRETAVGGAIHANEGEGEWLGGIAGDGATLAFTITRVGYRDPAACDARGECRLAVTGGYTAILGKRAIPVSGMAIAVSNEAVAIVAPPSGLLRAGPERTRRFEVYGHDGSRRVVGEASGVIREIAVWEDELTFLLDGALVMIREGEGRFAVPRGASDVSVARDDTVFRVGRAIYLWRPRTGTRRVATARAVPIGLSIEGKRIAWAENVRGRGYVRAITIR